MSYFKLIVLLGVLKSPNTPPSQDFNPSCANAYRHNTLNLILIRVLPYHKISNLCLDYQLINTPYITMCQWTFLQIDFPPPTHPLQAPMIYSLFINLPVNACHRHVYTLVQCAIVFSLGTRCCTFLIPIL